MNSVSSISLTQGAIRVRILICLLMIAGFDNHNPSFAWGTEAHSGILDAVLSCARLRNELYTRLGTDAGDLRMWVQMADWRDSLVSVGAQWESSGHNLSNGTTQFYANDYLIFPRAQRHFGHSPPDALNSYEPYFLRALQALRTETRSNSARWIGSLLHYITDSGSPPHAAGIQGIPGGGVHWKMENWVSPTDVELSAYNPVLLGRTDKEAVVGLQTRMQNLMRVSKLTAEELRPFVDRDDRAECERVNRKVVREIARVVADTLHTLLVLTRREERGGEIYADLTTSSLAGFEGLAAKLVLLNTEYSTMSEIRIRSGPVYRGHFSLRNLPPGSYRPVVYRLGGAPLYARTIQLRAGEVVRATWNLNVETGNLIRNADFRLRWVSGLKPDHWAFSAKDRSWVSDNIKVEAGVRYRTQADVIDESDRAIFLEWMEEHWLPLGGRIQISVQKSEIQVQAAPAKAKFARVIIAGPGDPMRTIRSVSLTIQSQTR